MNPNVISRHLLALATLGLCLSSSLRAQDSESKLGTPITSLPYNITASGVYSVDTELPPTTMQSGAAITISADNVTLELNGHTLSNTTSGNSAEGIYAADHKNITVRNGAVRGFLVGVDLPSSVADGSRSSAHVVENMAVSGSTWFGIRVYGNGNVIRRCQVYSSGGSVAGDSNGYGIIVQTGSGNRVLYNEVTGVQAAGSSHASYGICILGSADAMVVANRVAKTQAGVYYNGGSSGKYRDNLVSDAVTSPFTGGTNAGVNGVAGDENGDGLADSWETKYFNTINIDPAGLAPNGSGLTIDQMYLLNLNPLVEQQSSSLAPVAGLTVAVSGTQATLSWTSGGNGIRYYCIQCSLNGGSTWSNSEVVPGGGPTLAMLVLTPGTEYSFRVTAVDQTGFSSPSSPVISPLICLTTPLNAVLIY